MEWKKQHDFKSIKELVESNTNMTEAELFDLLKEYRIDSLDKVRLALFTAAATNQHVYIIADYDVDGVGACSIMTLLCRVLGVSFTVRIPKRFSEGYGLSEKIIDEIPPGSLVITVDNGITAVKAIEKAKEKGLAVIVTDHHLALENGELPPADIIIDPNAVEGSSDFNGFCGAGIALKIAECTLGKFHPEVRKMTSIAAISTVADVVPLIRANRQIVINGMQNLVTQDGRTTGLHALLHCTQLDRHINETNIGYTIAPILNAPGRMLDDGAKKSYELLVYEGDFGTALEMAQELIQINEDRKEAVKEGMMFLEEDIILNGYQNSSPLCIYEPLVSEGIVGILAGRYAEMKQMPVFIFSDSHHDSEIIKGSARTYGDAHLKKMLDMCAKRVPLEKYGGHAKAAGVSLKKEYFDKFCEVMQEVKNELYPQISTEPCLEYDFEIDEAQIPEIFPLIRAYGPFGEGNPPIKFKINDFVLTPNSSGFMKTMGDNNQHLKLYGTHANAIGFDLTAEYHKLGNAMRLNMIGTLSENWYLNNHEIQIELLDFTESQCKPAKTLLAQLLEKKAKQKH